MALGIGALGAQVLGPSLKDAFPLPDCPSCDAANSLKPIRGDGPSVWCECSCCSKQCLVKDGRVVHHSEDVRDVSGNQMHDP